MEVKLLHHTPLWVAAQAIRTAWDSHDKSDTRENYWACSDCSWLDNDTPLNHCGAYECPECGSTDVYFVKKQVGEKDKALIERVGNKFKHASTLECLVYNFEIKGISRALLQELARHRIASLTVKSTRYTIKELKNKMIMPENVDHWCVIPKELTEQQEANWRENVVLQLGQVKSALQLGLSNDKVKYLLPESFKTELVWTINARSLQNFLSLRSDKSALWEIRELALLIYLVLPKEHQYLFTDFVKSEEGEGDG